MMPADLANPHTNFGTKSGWVQDDYRRLLQRPDLTDREPDELRRHVGRLTQALCEQISGKRFH